MVVHDDRQETLPEIAEIRLLSERQMGAFLKAMPKATGAAGYAGPGRGNAVPMEHRVSEPATLAEIGITKKQSATAQKLADIPAEEFHEQIAVVKASGGGDALHSDGTRADCLPKAVSRPPRS